MTALSAWFAGLEARGDNVDILVGRARAPTAPFEWQIVSHADFDGLGALAEWFSHATGRPIDLPVRSPRDPGGTRSVIGPAVEIATRTLGWRPMPTFPPAAPEVVWWTADELAALRARAAAEGCSIGTCLLWSIHEAIVEETATPDLDEGAWMVTMNLRTNPRPLDYGGNYASFVLGCPGIGSMGELHDDITNRLARGEHWATAMLLDKLTWRSASKVAFGTRLLDTTSNAFIGVYGNFGEWTIPELAGERWCISGPPTALTPTVIALLCLNGTLSVSARSIAFPPDALQRVLQRAQAIALT